ncbi:hypothetical protein SEUCBS140593_001030 [Sporothrix eucalyptigena]|uniref:L-ornithine N(5)-monooxygenase [NAD(P)H] n=1 Tax=Sporothrix eucalyptigena TaxID=1812306 RepID=A0ABP0AUU3_9PEZI
MTGDESPKLPPPRSLHVEGKTIRDYPATTFHIEDHPVDERRNLRVVVIGAGLAGITAGVLLPHKVPGIHLTIFEKNADVGGVWLENTYPGVRCDVPAHVYQSSIEPNTQWTEQFAQGAEIRRYWQETVARKRGVYEYVALNSDVTRAEWVERDDSAEWVLTVRDTRTNETRTEVADIVITAIGRYNAWRLPDYPGLQGVFEGEVWHTSNWSAEPRNVDNKRVAVIGNGASGVQVVPNLQPRVARLDHYARNPTWVAGAYTGDNERTLGPQPIPESLRQSFVGNDDAYLAYRKEVESPYWRRFEALFRHLPANDAARTQYRATMAKRVSKKPELLEKLVPSFAPHCRRLTPAPGYLEALCEDNVEYITTPIRRFTRRGIETTDGTVREVDAVICATGANVDAAPPFSIVARGVDLREAWSPGGLYGWPYSYLGVATPGFPNLFFLGGPHASGPSGTVPSAAENYVAYLARFLRKISSQGIRSMEPTKRATDDFVAYSDAWFPQTYLTDACSAWTNGGQPGGRINALWPGSAAHERYVRFDPRNGWTAKERDPTTDLTWYLKRPADVDLQSWYDNWYDLW